MAPDKRERVHCVIDTDDEGYVRYEQFSDEVVLAALVAFYTHYDIDETDFLKMRAALQAAAEAKSKEKQ
jgi:hypothetical protein